MRRVFLPSVVGLFTLIATHKSWSWYVAKIHATRDLVVPSLGSFTTQPLLGRITATLSELAHRFFDTDYLMLARVGANHRPALWSVLVFFLILGSLVIALSKKSERLSVGMTVSVLSLGSVGYLAALFISYVIVFTEYEGVRLASFERYFSTYMIAWALIIVAFSANLICNLKARQTMVLNMLAVSIVAYFVPSNFYDDLTAIQRTGLDKQTRQSTEVLASNVKKHIQPDQKVYFVAQNSNGLERVMFYYAMLPYTSSMSWCWSFGKKYAVGDVWTCDMPMLPLLKGYDYLALYRVDKQFWDLYAGLFDVEAVGKTTGVFKVLRIDGVITKFQLLAQ